jgi:hypothetical protein
MPSDLHVSSDTKRKFRKALAQKQSHRAKNGPQYHADGKIAGPHDSETSGAQQMFRRKSGM